MEDTEICSSPSSWYTPLINMCFTVTESTQDSQLGGSAPDNKYE